MTQWPEPGRSEAGRQAGQKLGARSFFLVLQVGAEAQGFRSSSTALLLEGNTNKTEIKKEIIQDS